MSQQQQTYNWCVFQAHEQYSIIIEYVVLIAQIVIFATLIYVYMKAKKQKQLDQVSDIYKYIILWLICFFVKTLFNVIAYFVYMIYSPNKQTISAMDFMNFDYSNNVYVQQLNNTNFISKIDDPSDHITGLKTMSGLFFFLDLITTFFLQNAMMYIPYVWMSNALQFVSSQSLAFEDRKNIGRVYSFLEIIKIYMYFRLIYVLFFIMVAVLIVVQESSREYTKYTVIISIAQALVILCIYIRGSFAYQIIKEKISLEKQQQKNMFIEYIILMICSLIRIVLNSVFYFTNLLSYQPDEYCYDAHDDYQVTLNCIFVAFGLIFMHILPGSMILYVYWPNKKQKSDLRTSILVGSFQRY